MRSEEAEQVARWLDDHVKRLFRATGEPTVKRLSPSAGAKDRGPELGDSLPTTRVTSIAARSDRSE